MRPLPKSRPKRRSLNVGVDADAVVIGAGAAGLAAARELASRSARVIVLEARDRVGGRVWSREMQRGVTPAELGAEFIHGHAKETMRLLRDAGLAAVDVGGESWARENGELCPDDVDFTAAAGLFEHARELAQDESADRFLRPFERNEATREIAKRARAFVEGFEAADPALASARAIGDEWCSGVDSAIARPFGGYRPIVDALHGGVLGTGARIELSAIVRSISWRRGEVEIDVRDGSASARTIRARNAVVTLPVGVLRHGGDDREVRFDPILPAWKQAALASIEMGHAVRVTLWFRSAFWEEVRRGRYRDAGFFRNDQAAFAAYWTQLPVRSELIVAWAGGPRAIALKDVPVPELVERAIDGFGATLSERALVREQLEGGIVHDWSADPFSRGVYSYVAVGGGDARAQLAAPVDRTLFFAGEATSTDGQGGTVNGALESGERAAKEAATALGLAAIAES